MIRVGNSTLVAFALSLLAVTTTSQAQLSVVDYPALSNIVQQVKSTEQVLTNARNQLLQAQQALQTMTGNRGMQLLLGNVVRNYLPTSWAPVNGAPQGLAINYPSLAASALALVSGNAVLSSQTLGTLSSADQQRILTARNTAAMNQALSRDAVSNASGRFADMQSLISTIGATSDQKGILELQARIGAEQGMLQNEQTKLQNLFQALQADVAAAHEQTQEQVIAGHGQFVSRFQPTP